MVKYLLGVLSGVLLVFFLGLFVALVLLALRTGEPGIEKDSVLVVRIEGGIPEHSVTDVSLELFRTGPPATLLDLRNNLKKAARDERIRAIALHLGGLRTGWAKAQEIRWGIEEFKKSGKPVVAFLQVGGTLDYLVASAADEIYMPPEGLLDVKGLRAEATFFKDTLDKMGVVAELEQIGKYKSAAEPFSRSSMSDAYREVVNSILDEVYGQFLETVGPARGKSADDLRAILDRGPFIPAEALEAGLVDDLKFEDQFYEALEKKLDLEEAPRVKLGRYRKVSMDSLGLTGENQIAVVYAVGDILRGRGESDPFFGSLILGSDEFSETVRRVREDEKIKAVIVRIDSPGGDAIASDQMWREMNLLDEKKPLVVSMSDVAASGGYYLAMTGAPIVAYPGTYTGSIGVVFGKLNLRGLYDKLGVKKEILTRGRFAAIDSDYRSLTPEEREKLRADIESLYKGFVSKVAEARGRSWEEIHEVAQGRVWMGSQAFENGLVDELGGFDTAIAMAKQAAGLTDDDQVTLNPYPPPKQMFELLFDRERMGRVVLGENRSPVMEWLRGRFGDIPAWPALIEGGMMRIAPYWVTVN